MAITETLQTQATQRTHSSPNDNHTADIEVPLPPLSSLPSSPSARNESTYERTITRTPKIQNQTTETPTPTSYTKIPLALKHLASFSKAGSGYYPSNFVYSCFSSKIQFLYCLLSSVALWGGPMVDTKVKIFEI